MKINKKAQGEIITTVLIILLVLAAIIIVWQVVSNAVKGGGRQVDEQTACIGVEMEVTQGSAGNIWNVKRGTQGDTFDSADVALLVIANGNTIATSGTGVPIYALSGVVTDFKEPLASRTLTITQNTTPIKTVEVALKVKTTVCGLTGKWP